VQENLELGAYTSGSGSLRQEAMTEILDIFPRLAERRSQLAGRSVVGSDRCWPLARHSAAPAGAAHTRRTLAGLAPVTVEHIFEVIEQVRDRCLRAHGGTAREMALEIADHAYVLEMGSIVADGSSSSCTPTPAPRRRT
jgi:branched-chain amino acid transport system ATP-binding protein